MVCLIGMNMCVWDRLHRIWLWLASVTISILGEQSTYNQAKADVCGNIAYPSETHPKLKSTENSFVYNIDFNSPMV